MINWKKAIVVFTHFFLYYFAFLNSSKKITEIWTFFDFFRGYKFSRIGSFEKFNFAKIFTIRFINLDSFDGNETKIGKEGFRLFFLCAEPVLLHLAVCSSIIHFCIAEKDSFEIKYSNIWVGLLYILYNQQPLEVLGSNNSVGWSVVCEIKLANELDTSTRIVVNFN